VDVTTILITSTDRDLLHRTATAVAPLPLPGCAAFAAACQHIAQGSARPELIADLVRLAGEVHRALAAETAADRWLPDLETMGLPLAEAMEAVAALVAERETQADLVAAVGGLAVRVADSRSAIGAA
jgi:hypothetical protein